MELFIAIIVGIVISGVLMNVCDAVEERANREGREINIVRK